MSRLAQWDDSVTLCPSPSLAQWDEFVMAAE